MTLSGVSRNLEADEHAATAPGVGEICLQEACETLAHELKQLIDRESNQAEHQMRHDLAGSADTNEARSELILEPAIDAFHHGAQLKALLLGRREGKPFAREVGRPFPCFVIAPQVALGWGDGAEHAVGQSAEHVRETCCERQSDARRKRHPSGHRGRSRVPR